MRTFTFRGCIPKTPGFYLRIFCLVALSSQLSCAFAEVHVTLTGTTNYVWRMYSKSDNNPAIQGNLDYQFDSGIFTGISLSSFDFGNSDQDDKFFPDSAELEITPYVGWSHKLADDWRIDLQYSRYFYNARIFGLNADYNELYLFLHYKDLLTLQASYIDDYYGLGKDSLFYELTGRYPLTDYLEVSSSFGYGQTQNSLNSDYPYWNVGLTGRSKYFALDLRYYDAKEISSNGVTTRPNHPKTLESTAVLTLSVGF